MNSEESSFKSDMGTSAVVRVIEQCCFNSVPDPFNGKTVNFILKPQKVIESRTYILKNLIWNNIETALFDFSDDSTAGCI